jgi:hypothetical protein
VGGTTIFWGGSLVEKIIARVYFVMQSADFLNFRSRNLTEIKAQKIWVCHGKSIKPSSVSLDFISKN